MTRRDGQTEQSAGGEGRKKTGGFVVLLDKGGNNIFHLRLVDKHHSAPVDGKLDCLLSHILLPLPESTPDTV